MTFLFLKPGVKWERYRLSWAVTELEVYRKNKELCDNTCNQL